MCLATKQEMPDDELEQKFQEYGITYSKKPKETIIEEADIDYIIERALFSRRNGPTKNDRTPTIEAGPTFRSSDFRTKEDLEKQAQIWYDDVHFNNQIIPGYLTNNSQFIHRLQEKLNQAILASIEDYVHLQNNLLKLLRDEDLLAFAN